MAYSKARSNAAYCVANTTGGKIRHNANDERAFYEACAEHGGYGMGARTAWTFKNSSTARRLGDRLVAKGLLVKIEEGYSFAYRLAPEPQAYFDSLVEAFERKQTEEDAERAAQKLAAESARMYAVFVHDNRRIYGKIDGKVHQNVFTGPTGKADAEAYAADIRNTCGPNTIVHIFEVVEDITTFA
jgi:hypothetical protein